ncbi:receptor-type tyrosine-protein phosphatase C [Pholidichthys leucotaenia]
MPATTTHLPTSISIKTPLTPTLSQTNSSHNLTSPPITPTNTAVSAASKDNKTKTESVCSYKVTPITFGLKFDITNNDNGTYIITVVDKVRGQEIKKEVVGQTPHEVIHLKPCTEYEHKVVFIDSHGTETPCSIPGNKTTTTEMNKNDLGKTSSCIPGCVCYQSSWDLSNLTMTPHKAPVEKCGNDSQTFHFKLDYEDICSNISIIFKSESCNNSYNYNEHISVDFLDPSEINQTKPTGLPANIKPMLPSKCKDLRVDYSCKDERGVIKNLSDVEPSKNYTCTGLITSLNTSLNITTRPISFNISCGFRLNVKNTTDSTSISLSWTTETENCRNISNNLSYSCNCNSSERQDQTKHHKNTPVAGTFTAQPGGGSCRIDDLKPYTDYKCQVRTKYNDRVLHDGRYEGTLKTKPGVPADIENLEATPQEHNVIKVTCKNTDFNGPDGRYRARLYTADGDKEIKQRKMCEFEFKDLSYLTTYSVEVTAFNSQYQSKSRTKQVKTLYNDKALIGFLVFLIILTSVALLFVIYKIYILKRRNSHDLDEGLSLIPTGSDEENLLPVEPIAAEVLLEAYKRKLADEGRLFLAEFQSIPRIFSRYTGKDAKKSYNVPKNRYVDILPYDYNRVQLSTGNGEAGCDYINASFIDGYKEPKKYIAAQGPKDETVTDFWRMIWEQQSSIIVMVTRCEEGNRVKCAQYWPSKDREVEIFEEFIVKLNSEDECPDYTIRRLTLTNKREKNSEREVTHIQFMSWPDHGVPGDPHLLLKLRRRVNSFKNFFSGPIVVHCSAGVGRTGTYIGIDAMMEGLEAENRVDIYGYVVRLRRQRCLMVQVEAQYILIHQALLEHNQFGETEISLPEFHSSLDMLKEKGADNEPTLMEEEFERLPTFKNWRTFNTGITGENKKKNRSSSVIPYDYNRVLLKLDEGNSHDSDREEDDEDESSDEDDEDSTKYINASHIDGYWGPRAFITAQTPLADTVADFWLMVHQKKVSAIVMLDSSRDSDSEYWEKEKKDFGDIEVEVVNTDTTPTFITRTISIHHGKRKDSRTVKHFQFLKWESRDVPERPQDFIDMIKDVKRCPPSSKSLRNNPIVVHCNDGSSRSGIFCALWNLLDSAETEKLVDVFQVVKTLRKERQNMLSSPEHYMFLYDALEVTYPVQNGDAKPVQASAADSVQIVNETKTAKQPEEKQAEQPASTTSNDQQAAAESSALVTDGGKDKKEEPEQKSDAPPQEEASNGPTVTMQV